MTTTPLGQLVRNAIAVEEAAASFYRRLAGATDEALTRGFLLELSNEEDRHARQIRDFAARLAGGLLPDRPDFPVEGVEAAPEWSNASDLTLAQALEIAHEAEVHAYLFYDSVADSLEGPAQAFFRTLAATELEHVTSLARRRRSRAATG